MPVYIIGEDILDKRTECVVCPVKVARLYLYEDICGKIYKKAGRVELSAIFDEVNPMAFAVPVITTGLKLSDYIIHIIVSDFTLCKTFKSDMYKSYNDIMKLIVDNNIKTIVMPPLCYSYKRLGDKNSYRSCAAFLRYFLDLYHLDCNIFIMVDKRTIHDHITNYVSTYVSTSFPVSKRHKPAEYSLTNVQEIEEFVEGYHYVYDEEFPTNPVIVHNEIMQEENYHFEFKNTKFESLYKLIKSQYTSDAHFCFKANINKATYQQFIEDPEYTPLKNTLLAICIALKLDVDQINQVLLKYLNVTLNKEEGGDQIIISHIEEQNFDVISINERLFYEGYGSTQLGSYFYPAYPKKIRS